MNELFLRLPPMAGYTKTQLARTREDLGYILQFLEAALLTDDPRIFLDEFLPWLTRVLTCQRGRRRPGSTRGRTRRLPPQPAAARTRPTAGRRPSTRRLATVDNLGVASGGVALGDPGTPTPPVLPQCARAPEEDRDRRTRAWQATRMTRSDHLGLGSAFIEHRRLLVGQAVAALDQFPEPLGEPGPRGRRPSCCDRSCRTGQSQDQLPASSTTAGGRDLRNGLMAGASSTKAKSS
jgi:hypothetical protein